MRRHGSEDPHRHQWNFYGYRCVPARPLNSVGDDCRLDLGNYFSPIEVRATSGANYEGHYFWYLV